MKTALFLLCCLAFAGCGESFQSREHDHEEKAQGAKAVLESSETLGFRLSPQAIQTLGIETTILSREGVTGIPPEALVYFQDEIGVYRLREGWFRLVHLDDPQELRAGDSVAVRGAAYLRVTDLSLSGGELAGHHH